MKFWKKLVNIIWFSRIFIGFVIFYNPLIAVIISLVLDRIDAPIAFKAGESWRQYTNHDKILDFLWYVFVLVFSIRWPIFSILLILFVFRTIGQVIVLVTNNHRVLFWFPNVFENYFIIYLLVLTFWPQYQVYFIGVTNLLPLLIAFITKMPEEWINHRLVKDDWHPLVKKIYKKIG